MSEPEDKIAKWCLQVVESFIAMRPDSSPISTAKGGSRNKLASPIQGDAHTASASPEESSEKDGGRESARMSGAESEGENGAGELLHLIRNFEQSALQSGDTLVPDTLPPEIRDNIYTVQLRQFVDVFKVEKALERVHEGTISRTELVCMYLKSFRNIFNYQLAELRGYKQYYERISGFFAHVFQDVIESLYPAQHEPHSLVGYLA